MLERLSCLLKRLLYVTYNILMFSMPVNGPYPGRNSKNGRFLRSFKSKFYVHFSPKLFFSSENDRILLLFGSIGSLVTTTVCVFLC